MARARPGKAEPAVGHDVSHGAATSPTTMDVGGSPLGVTGVAVGVGVRTVIVMLSSVPVMLPARSSTVPLPPLQP